MADTHTKVREVVWSEVFPWLMLLRSVTHRIDGPRSGAGRRRFDYDGDRLGLLWQMFSGSSDPVIAGWKHSTNLGSGTTRFIRRPTSRGSIRRPEARRNIRFGPRMAGPGAGDDLDLFHSAIHRDV